MTKFAVWIVCNSEINWVVVITSRGKHSYLHHPLPISLVLSSGLLLQTTYRFTYKLDPRIANIKPRNHLIVSVIIFSYGTLAKCSVAAKIELFN